MYYLIFLCLQKFRTIVRIEDDIGTLREKMQKGKKSKKTESQGV